ncbi:hypothetical protein NDU88_006817 [Pleurodeles waltl]|uniref:Uncharacterized protein n=1 Tax=Pleurodeles waltl TaxID=8319 RepID=A0AAV7SQQ8_PLEWA|nr:hypothetical protein NDU88_006817 [Pleurodeles waltl]
MRGTNWEGGGALGKTPVCSPPRGLLPKERLRRDAPGTAAPPQASARLHLSVRAPGPTNNLRAPGVCRGHPGGVAEAACDQVAAGLPPTPLFARPPRARLDARLPPHARTNPAGYRCTGPSLALPVSGASAELGKPLGVVWAWLVGRAFKRCLTSAVAGPETDSRSGCS